MSTLLKTVLLFVFLVTWEQKWCRRFARISSFPTRGHSSKFTKRRRSYRSKVWKKNLESLRADLESLQAEYIAVCMQRWSFRFRSLSWETSFDWSEMKRRAFPGVFSHPTVRTWPGFAIKKTPPNFSCGKYLQLRIAVSKMHFTTGCAHLLRDEKETQ